MSPAMSLECVIAACLFVSANASAGGMLLEGDGVRPFAGMTRIRF
jgi:hypothetical protein